MTRNLRCSGGYESGAINARVSAARPDLDVEGSNPSLTVINAIKINFLLPVFKSVEL
ncbi:hypothetical protein OAT13_01830 [Gammaproteobacteria bacterium]|nr:hypothetical protein [Gammaproteobacteria bacterium]